MNRVKEPLFRSSPPELFLRKGFLKICSKFTGEHSCWGVISINLLCIFIEITLRYGCPPVNLLHILRTPFYKNTYGGMLFVIWKRVLFEDVLNKYFSQTVRDSFQICNYFLLFLGVFAYFHISSFIFLLLFCKVNLQFLYVKLATGSCSVKKVFWVVFLHGNLRCFG